MDTDTLKGKWEQLKGNIQRDWGKLTNDDMDVIEGDAKILVGKLRERYGMTKEAAEKEVEKYKA